MVREEVGRETETQTETEAERWRQENTPLWPLLIMTLSRTGGGGGPSWVAFCVFHLLVLGRKLEPP